METVETSKEFGGFYYLENHLLGRSNSMVNNHTCFVSKLTWHNRLGHPIDKALNVLKHILNFDSESFMSCDIFHKAKQTREPFPLSEHKFICLGELVHLDVRGPYRVADIGGFRFFLPYLMILLELLGSI